MALQITSTMSIHNIQLGLAIWSIRCAVLPIQHEQNTWLTHCSPPLLPTLSVLMSLMYLVVLCLHQTMIMLLSNLYPISYSQWLLFFKFIAYIISKHFSYTVNFVFQTHWILKHVIQSILWWIDFLIIQRSFVDQPMATIQTSVHPFVGLR